MRGIDSNCRKITPERQKVSKKCGEKLKSWGNYTKVTESHEKWIFSEAKSLKLDKYHKKNTFKNGQRAIRAYSRILWGRQTNLENKNEAFYHDSILYGSTQSSSKTESEEEVSKKSAEQINTPKTRKKGWENKSSLLRFSYFIIPKQNFCNKKI